MKNRQYQSTVNVDKISITSAKNGKVFDIKDICDVLHIYENLFFPGITGYIDITDTIDMCDVIPIRGEEDIDIVFKTEGLQLGQEMMDGTFSKIFSIYKISNVKIGDNVKMFKYRLHFCSKHLIEDKRYRLSMSLGTENKPIKISDMISTIVTKNLKIDSKIFNINETVNSKYFIVPNLSPIQTIQFLANEARPSPSATTRDPDSTYIFFENAHGIYFVPFELLFEDKILSQYTNKPDKLQIQDVSASMMKTKSSDKEIDLSTLLAIDVNWSKWFDNHENSQNGLFGSTTVFHDLLQKTVKYHTFDYQKNFKDSQKAMGLLDDIALTDPLVNVRSGSKFENVSLLPSNKSTHYNLYFDSYSTASPWKNKIKARIQLLNNNIAECRVGGNSLLLLGQILTMDIQSAFHAVNNLELLINKNGKYILTKIHHEILVQDKKYFQNIEMRKPHLNKGRYPEESRQN